MELTEGEINLKNLENNANFVHKALYYLIKMTLPILVVHIML